MAVATYDIPRGYTLLAAAEEPAGDVVTDKGDDNETDEEIHDVSRFCGNEAARTIEARAAE